MEGKDRFLFGIVTFLATVGFFSGTLSLITLWVMMSQ